MYKKDSVIFNVFPFVDYLHFLSYSLPFTSFFSILYSFIALDMCFYLVINKELNNNNNNNNTIIIIIIIIIIIFLL